MHGSVFFTVLIEFDLFSNTSLIFLIYSEKRSPANARAGLLNSAPNSVIPAAMSFRRPSVYLIHSIKHATVFQNRECLKFLPASFAAGINATKHSKYYARRLGYLSSFHLFVDVKYG